MIPIICNDCIDFIETGKISFSQYSLLNNYKTLFYYKHINHNCIVSSINRSCIDNSFILGLRTKFTIEINNKNLDSYLICTDSIDEDRLKDVFHYSEKYIVFKTKDILELLNSILKKIEYSLLLG